MMNMLLDLQREISGPELHTTTTQITRYGFANSQKSGKDVFAGLRDVENKHS